jgi:hypothetical protein
MSKYIIDLNDDVQIVQKVGVTEKGNAFVMNFNKDQLEELTADYINEHFGDLQEDAYQRGLNDAWEAARKIADMWTRIDNDKLLAIFGITERIGYSTIRSLFEKQTANEAMLELEAYEEKQKADDKIEVGDEVEISQSDENGVWVVVKVEKHDDYEAYCAINKDGDIYFEEEHDRVTKTGRHFDIDKILEDMRND